MILYDYIFLTILIFLLLTLLLGICVTQKSITFRQYAVGNKRFHTITLVITVLATAFDGGALARNMPNVYRFGIDYIVFLFGSVITYYIISLLALRMGPFMQHFSISETIGSVYGIYPRIISALLSICLVLGNVATQINILSSTIRICTSSIDPHVVTVLATLILIAYAMLGGVHAVTITDVLQFIIFMTVIALLIKFLFTKTSKSLLEIVWTLKQEERFQFSKFIQWSPFDKVQFDKSLFSVVQRHLWFAFILHPSVIQRVYMSSGPIQAYKVFLRVTLFSVIIMGCIVLMSLFVFVGNPTLSVTEIWTYILADMSPAYKVCVVVCLLGMVMSTVDSYLHTISIMIAYDMIESIRVVRSGTYARQLRLAKLSILVFSLLAIIIADAHSSVFQLSKLVFYFIAFFGAIVIPPFILAVFGFRGSSRTALIGMAVGALFHFYWEKWVKPEIGIYSGIFPMVANGLSMMASHYLLPQPAGKGWIGRTDQQNRMQQLIREFKKYKKRLDQE